MDQAAVIKTIIETFEDVHIADSNGNRFFFRRPYEGADNKFPFATLVTTDEYDNFSNLSRPGVFRLNIGVGKETFLRLFGTKIAEMGEGAHDFTALDTVLPHPVYGKMYWVCVLNPGDATFEAVRPLLAEAYEMAAKK